MADHPPIWPRCACERCFAAAARAVIGGALPAIVAGAFTIAAPAAPPPARKPRRDRNEPPPGSGWRMARGPQRRKPVRRRRPEVVQPKADPPLVVAPQVDDVPPPEPEVVHRRPRAIAKPRAATRRLAAAAIAHRDVKPENVPPPADVAQVDAAEPERSCRVCGETEPASWAQVDLCSSMTCIGEAWERRRKAYAAARKAPAAARAKRLGKIAKLAGRRERFAAQAERADLGGDEDEDLVERIEEIPEVADA